MMLQRSGGSTSDPGLMTEAQARQLAERVLRMATGVDEARVNITSSWTGNTRFADASITTSGGITDTSVTVTVTIGRKRASPSRATGPATPASRTRASPRRAA